MTLESSGTSALCRLKIAVPMGTVTERPVCRSTAATQRNCLFALQIKSIAFTIADLDRTGDQKRTVVTNGDFYVSHLHLFLRVENLLLW